MPPDPEPTVLNYVQTHGSITRREVVELWDLSENQAAYLLKKLVEQGKLQVVGQGRGTLCWPKMHVMLNEVRSPCIPRGSISARHK